MCMKFYKYLYKCGVLFIYECMYIIYIDVMICISNWRQLISIDFKNTEPIKLIIGQQHHIY